MSDRLAKPLYGYQRDALDRVLAEFGNGNRSVVLSATMGAGKTVMAADLMSQFRDEGQRCWFVVDTTNLAHQTMERFAEYGLSSGLLQAANDRDVSEPVLVCSLQTLERRDYARIGKKLECGDQCVKSCDGKVCAALYDEEFDLSRAWLPDLLVVDECHRAWRYWRRVGRAVRCERRAATGVERHALRAVHVPPVRRAGECEDDGALDERGSGAGPVQDVAGARGGLRYAKRCWQGDNADAWRSAR